MHTDQQRKVLLTNLWQGLGGSSELLDAIQFEGHQQLPSAFAVTAFAVAGVGSAGLATAEWVQHQQRLAHTPQVVLDVHQTNAWIGTSYQPKGWTPPTIWDAIAGDYPTADGWIRLHTNAPHHKRATLAVLDVPEDRAAVAAAVKRWNAIELETAVIQAGGCAAEMRTAEAWHQHPQGQAVAQEPLMHWHEIHTDVEPRPLRIIPGRPLAGIRVLDLTRIIAGPVATRYLAMLGADVLRIDPPAWDEAGLVETTLGKRCATLDLKQANQLEQFVALLAQADVLIHGYRGDALERLGLDVARRSAINPRLVDVSLNAFGWTGPWANRRGFDSLVQMSTGIAAAGQAFYQKDKPHPLPVQALDHATGYLLAAAAIRGLTRLHSAGHAVRACTSLARMADVLLQFPDDAAANTVNTQEQLRYFSQLEQSGFGPLRRLEPPLYMESVTPVWQHPASKLGTSPPVWADNIF